MIVIRKGSEVLEHHRTGAEPLFSGTTRTPWLWNKTNAFSIRTPARKILIANEEKHTQHRQPSLELDCEVLVPNNAAFTFLSSFQGLCARILSDAPLSHPNPAAWRALAISNTGSTQQSTGTFTLQPPTSANYPDQIIKIKSNQLHAHWCPKTLSIHPSFGQQ